jgi:hypothetical protein
VNCSFWDWIDEEWSKRCANSICSVGRTLFTELRLRGFATIGRNALSRLLSPRTVKRLCQTAAVKVRKLFGGALRPGEPAWGKGTPPGKARLEGSWDQHRGVRTLSAASGCFLHVGSIDAIQALLLDSSISPVIAPFSVVRRRFPRENEAPGERRPLNPCARGTKKLPASIRLTTMQPPEGNADEGRQHLSGCKISRMAGRPTHTRLWRGACNTSLRHRKPPGRC